MAKEVLIGVTGPSRGIPWSWWAIGWRLSRLGARAIRLTAREGDPGSRRFAGFIIAGGNDIGPAVYGGDTALARDVDPLRDQFELAVLQRAEHLGIPVLGICRGAQLLNVYAGGTLLGDIRNLRVTTSNQPTLRPVKAIRVARDSHLHGLLGAEKSRVNSLHHQAVDRLGAGIAATAWDSDDIVQGIEARRKPLRLGVQWHPEYLPQRSDQRRLFRRFVAECRAVAGRAS